MVDNNKPGWLDQVLSALPPDVLQSVFDSLPGEATEFGKRIDFSSFDQAKLQSYFDTMKDGAKAIGQVAKLYASLKAADWLADLKPIKMAIQYSESLAGIKQQLGGLVEANKRLSIASGKASAWWANKGVTRELAYQISALGLNLGYLSDSTISSNLVFSEWVDTTLLASRATGTAAESIGQFMFRMDSFLDLTKDSITDMSDFAAGLKEVADMSSLSYGEFMNMDEVVIDLAQHTSKSGSALKEYTLTLAAMKGELADVGVGLEGMVDQMEKMIDVSSQEGMKSVYDLSVYMGRSVDDIRSMIKESPEELLIALKETAKGLPEVGTYLGNMYRDEIAKAMGLSRRDIIQIEKMNVGNIREVMDRAFGTTGQGKGILKEVAGSTVSGFADRYASIQKRIEIAQAKLGNAIMPIATQGVLPMLEDSLSWLEQNQSFVGGYIRKAAITTAELPATIMKGISDIGGAMGKLMEDAKSFFEELKRDYLPQLTSFFSQFASLDFANIGKQLSESLSNQDWKAIGTQIADGVEEAIKQLLLKFGVGIPSGGQGGGITPDVINGLNDSINAMKDAWRVTGEVFKELTGKPGGGGSGSKLPIRIPTSDDITKSLDTAFTPPGVDEAIGWISEKFSKLKIGPRTELDRSSHMPNSDQFWFPFDPEGSTYTKEFMGKDYERRRQMMKKYSTTNRFTSLLPSHWISDYYVTSEKELQELTDIEWRKRGGKTESEKLFDDTRQQNINQIQKNMQMFQERYIGPQSNAGSTSPVEVTSRSLEMVLSRVATVLERIEGRPVMSPSSVRNQASDLAYAAFSGVGVG
jgi:hypothetical protein